MDNARLMRMREKLVMYNFKVIWVPGHSHEVADALSRSPVFDQKDEEEEDEETEKIDTAVEYCKQASRTFSISQIIKEIDGPYKKLIEDIRQDRMSTGKEIKQHNKKRYQSDRCLLYTSPSPRDLSTSRMPSSA